MINQEAIIDNLCSPGFHVIDNWLAEEHYHSLQHLAQEYHEKGLFRAARIGSEQQLQQNSDIRTDVIHWLDEESSDPAVQAYLKKAKDLAQLLNQTLYLGLNEFETHFANYAPGSFYNRHIDQFSTNNQRKISCVYYLNHDWQPEFGGELKLYNKEEQFLETILPVGNRFVCFNSELPHEVCVTKTQRYSITGWLKSNPCKR
jgi:SM-20-related protein